MNRYLVVIVAVVDQERIEVNQIVEARSDDSARDLAETYLRNVGSFIRIESVTVADYDAAVVERFRRRLAARQAGDEPEQ